MIRFQHSVQIDRHRDAVFDVLTDVEKLPLWQSGVVQSRAISQGPVRPGFQFAETVKVGFWKVDTVCTVTEVKPGQRYGFEAKSSGPVEYAGFFELQPVASGTRLTVNATARLKGIWRLLEPLLSSDIKRETRTEMANLKRLIEAEGYAASVPEGSRA